jgi:hypothetical protein
MHACVPWVRTYVSSAAPTPQTDPSACRAACMRVCHAVCMHVSSAAPARRAARSACRTACVRSVWPPPQACQSRASCAGAALQPPHMRPRRAAALRLPLAASSAQHACVGGVLWQRCAQARTCMQQLRAGGLCCILVLLAEAIQSTPGCSPR